MTTADVLDMMSPMANARTFMKRIPNLEIRKILEKDVLYVIKDKEQKYQKNYEV